MKYDTPLNLLVISIIFAILLLVNLVLKEKKTLTSLIIKLLMKQDLI